MPIPSNIQKRLQTITANFLKSYQDQCISALYDDGQGFTSALQIAAMTTEQFVEQVKDKITSEDAQTIHRNAVVIQQRVQHLLANLKDTAASAHYQAGRFNNIHDDIKDFHQSIPDFQDLFGKVLANDGQEFSSLYSPAAYFLDLMRLVDNYITQPNEEDLMLENRRPDLWDVPLDVAHTETEVPYLQIVNEVMIKNLNKQLPGEDPRKVIAISKHPFNLPYNLPLEEIRTYLQHFKVSLADVYEAFGVKDFFVAREKLGLSVEGADLLTREASTIEQVSAAYGIQASAPQFNGEKSSIRVGPMEVNFSKGFTLEAWVYYSEFKNWSRIIDFGEHANNFVLANEARTQKIIFRVFNGGIFAKYEDLPTNVKWKAQTWMHLAVSINHNGEGVLYIDGNSITKFKNKNLLPKGKPWKSSKNLIGKSNWSGIPFHYDELFDGQISDVRIWNIARTADEIKNGMSRRLSGNESGLASYWPLDERGGTIARNLANPNSHGIYEGTFNFGLAPSQLAPSQHALNYLNHLDVFLAQTGLSRLQLQDLLYQGLEKNVQPIVLHSFYINQSLLNEAYLNILSRNISQNQQQEVFAQTNLATFDRLQRFIRLANVLGWNYADLDWALRSIEPLLPLQISEGSIIRLANIKNLQSKYGLTIEEICSFWGDMKTVGPKQDDRFEALFDKVFNTPAAFYTALDENQPQPYHPFYGQNPLFLDTILPWSPYEESDERHNKIRSGLLAKLQLGNKELNTLLDYLFSHQLLKTEEGEAIVLVKSLSGIGKNISSPVPLSVPNLSQLYRFSRMAKMLQLQMEDLLGLLQVLDLTSFNSFDNVNQFIQGAEWVKKSGIQIKQLSYLVKGTKSQGTETGYTKASMLQLLQKLSLSFGDLYLKPKGLLPGITDELNQLLFDHLIKADCITDDGIILQKQIEQKKLKTLFMVQEDDFSKILIEDGSKFITADKFNSLKTTFLDQDGWIKKQNFDADTNLDGFAPYQKDVQRILLAFENIQQNKYIQYLRDSLTLNHTQQEQGIIVHLAEFFSITTDLMKEALSFAVQVSGKTNYCSFLLSYKGHIHTESFEKELESDKLRDNFRLAWQKVTKLKPGGAENVAIDLEGWPGWLISEGEIYLGKVEDPPKTDIQAFMPVLSSIVLLAKLFQLSAKELAAVRDSPGWFGIQPFSSDLTFTLPQLKTIREFKQLNQDFQNNSEELVDFIATLTSSQLANISGWKEKELNTLLKTGPSSFNITSISGLLALKKCFDLIDLLGVPLNFFQKLVQLKDLPATGNWPTYLNASRQTLNAMEAKYDKTTWDSIYKPFRGKLLEKERDVLASYLIQTLNKKFDDIRALRDLHDYLLIDVQMSSAMNISYVKEALNAMQLYIHRCRSGLEKGVQNNIPEKWWAWMNHYRIWEANRKVFLYPENYLDPVLRQSATPLFKELQQDLAPGNITDEEIKAVFHNYLQKLEALSTLIIVDSYYTLVEKPELGTKQRTLFLFGRTRTDPAEFYYRSAILDSETIEVIQWNPWQKIDGTIQAKTISAVYAFSRLFIFWVEQGTKSIQVPEPNNGSPASTQKAVVTTATIKYITRQSETHWSAPRTIKNGMPISIDPNILKNGNDYLSEINQVIQPDLDTDKRFWNRVYTLHLDATNSTPERIMILFGDLPRIPEGMAINNNNNNNEDDIDRLPAEPTKYPEQNLFNEMLFKAAETARDAAEKKVLGRVSLTPVIFLSNDLLVEEQSLIIRKQPTGSSYTLGISDGKLKEFRIGNLLLDNYFSEPESLEDLSIDDGSNLGFVSHWPMNEGGNETIYDHIGDNDGFLFNATWEEIDGFDAAPKSSGSELQTTQSRYVIEYKSNISIGPINRFKNPETWNGFTFECWIKPTNSTGDPGTLLTLVKDKGGPFVKIIYGNKREKDHLIVDFLGSLSDPIPCAFLDGKWHHLAITYDKKNLTVYSNDNELFSSEFGRNLKGIQGFTELYLGQSPDSDSDSANYYGLIAEIRLWTEARSTEQIKSTMHQKLSGREAGLIGYWPLDEGKNETLSDKTNDNSTKTFISNVVNPWKLVEDFPFLQEAGSIIPEEEENDVTPNLRSVLSFSSGDFVKINSFQTAALSQFTIACWIKSTEMGTILTLFSPKDENGIRFQALTILTNKGGLELIINGYSHLLTAPFGDGLWHHLVISWNSETGIVQVFKDGTKLPDEGSSTSTKGQIIKSGGEMFIGINDTFDNNMSNFGDDFIGQMAEMQLWNIALSPQEIKQMLSNSVGKSGFVQALISNISIQHGRVEVIKNMTGAFIFDNGNESFLIIPNKTAQPRVQTGQITTDKEIAPISHKLEFEHAPDKSHQILSLKQTTGNASNSRQYLFYKLNAESILQLSQFDFIEGPDKVLTLAAQQLNESPFQGYEHAPDKVLPKGSDKLDFQGSFKEYFWEIFFHIPFLIANSLKANQQFEAAKKWYEYIFKPIVQNENNRKPSTFWQFIPFKNHSLEKLNSMLSNPQEISAYEDDPFDPDAIARLRMGAYEKAIVMGYIDNLIKWGDNLFSQFNWEAIVEATMLYIEARDILGPKPATKALIEDKPAISYRQVSTATSIPDSWLAVEDQVDATLAAHPITQNPVNSLQTYGYFSIPENDQFLGYWGVVADRMFKIRHGENIEGIVEQLALFQPPIDPRALIDALASGQSLRSAISALSSAVPHYRFAYMVRQAKELAGTLVQLGSALLSALEKKDAAQLELLHATQVEAILQLTTQIKQQQIDAADEQVEILGTSKQNADYRFAHYQSLVNRSLSIEEIMSIALADAAITIQTDISPLHLGAAIAYAIPNIFGTADGGQNIGGAIDAGIAMADGIANTLNQRSGLFGTKANFNRRAEDWNLQMSLAQFDQQQIQIQIQAAQLQSQIATRELEIHQKSIQQAQDMEDYLKRKFSNQELYQWMISQVSSVYFQTYQLAFDLAQQAEKAFQYECNTNDTFISFAYWDSLKKGLLSGEGLMFSLQQMEKAYMDQNERKLEIEKTISLLQLDPLALLSLKQTGKCTFNLNEILFDYDFPGHYNRQIKTLSITIPAIVGPYQNVQATLTQQTNRIVLKADASAVGFLLPSNNNNGQNPDDDTLRNNWRPTQQIAISRGVEDAGLFHLNFQDERYLPFEGTGAVSSWELSMPKASNRINFDSISDVIIHLRYTAQSGGETFRQDVTSLDALKAYKGIRFLSLAQEFSSAWFAFTSGQSMNNDQSEIKFTINENMFPVNLTSLIIDPNVSLIPLSQNGQTINPSELTLNPPTPTQIGALTISTTKTSAENLKDILLIIPYSGDLAW